MHFKSFLSPPCLNRPRQAFTSQPPWLPHPWYKDYSLGRYCQCPFLGDLRERAASSLTRQTRTSCTSWANSKPRPSMGCIPPPLVWGVVPAPDRMSAESKCKDPVGAPASPAQARTCRSWREALRGPLLAAEFAGFWEERVREQAGLELHHLAIPAMTMQNTWEANAAQPQLLPRQAPCHHFLSLV